MIGCSCHNCGAVVPAGVKNHFIADDGRILCDKCSVGVKPVSADLYKKLVEIEEKEAE